MIKNLCEKTSKLCLVAQTAADLMSPNPISLDANASVREAIDLMIERNIGAAPVIDENGRSIGVVTMTDILVHNREYVLFEKKNSRLIHSLPQENEDGSSVVSDRLIDRAVVRDIMTPAVFTVHDNAPVRNVIRKLLDLDIHHIFVADDNGIIVGVISGRDILGHLA